MANQERTAPNKPADTKPASQRDLMTKEKRDYLAKTYGMTPERVDVVRNVIAIGATDVELEFFLATCQRLGLDPLAKQIWFVKRPKKITNARGDDEFIMVGEPQTSIDGYRTIAERSGEYRGQSPMLWCGPDGKWVDVWVKKEHPTAAKATIHREGFTQPLEAVAVFEEFQPKFRNGKSPPPWINSPANQIAKCAEALGLRKAFPRDLSGIVTDVESERFDLDAQAEYSKPPAAVAPATKQLDTKKTDHATTIVESAPTTAKQAQPVDVKTTAREILAKHEDTAAPAPATTDEEAATEMSELDRESAHITEIIENATCKEDLNGIGPAIQNATKQLGPDASERTRMLAAFWPELNTKYKLLPKKQGGR